MGRLADHETMDFQTFETMVTLVTGVEPRAGSRGVIIKMYG